MKNNQKKNKNTYGILGLGRFGYALAMELAAAGADLLVLDRDEEKVRELREYTENAYVVRNLDKKTLADCGVADCDVAVVCIGSQMDTSILTTLHLVSLGVPHVIAKAASAEQGEILEKLGAEVVYPERDMAIRLAHRMETSRMLDFIQLSEQLNISKLVIPEKAVGSSVMSANLRAKYGVNIIAIETGGKLRVSVDPNYLFQSGDILFVAGDKDSLNRLSTWA
ncbi:k+ transport systems NAD-binding component [Clostridium sp. CAG:448]|nr:k+ transport systems NAD-binding component [Clostridium sp. CAG:448]